MTESDAELEAAIRRYGTIIGGDMTKADLLAAAHKLSFYRTALLRLLDTERAERARLWQKMHADSMDRVQRFTPEDELVLLKRFMMTPVAEAFETAKKLVQAESALAAARERVAYAVAVLASEAGNISRAADIVWDVENGLLPTLPDALKPQALGIREVAAQIEGSLTALADHLRAALTPETP